MVDPRVVAFNVFVKADCPPSLLSALNEAGAEIALLAAFYKRLWDQEWSSGGWPGDFTLMQPGRMAFGCKEFGIGHDSEALDVWLGYAREHSGEMQGMFCGWLADQLMNELPKKQQALPRVRRVATV